MVKWLISPTMNANVRRDRVSVLAGVKPCLISVILAYWFLQRFRISGFVLQFFEVLRCYFSFFCKFCIPFSSFLSFCRSLSTLWDFGEILTFRHSYASATFKFETMDRSFYKKVQKRTRFTSSCSTIHVNLSMVTLAKEVRVSSIGEGRRMFFLLLTCCCRLLHLGSKEASQFA